MRASTGVHFAVWAPNAQRVSVVGDFNDWDGRRHVMRKRMDTGIWEIFIPGLGDRCAYKFEIIGADGVRLPLKADPSLSLRSCGPRPLRSLHAPTDFIWTTMATIARRGPHAMRGAFADVHLRSASGLLAAQRRRLRS